MGDKPIIRIAVPGDSAEEFMQNAAKQFRGDFFVAIDQAVGKFVRIEAPFLAGDVAVRGDAIAMPAVRNGRKGLVIRLVKLDSDSLGIPIPEAKQVAIEEPDDEDEASEFDPQPTMASPVSAAVAKSIRATASTVDRAPPVKLQPLEPTPAKKPVDPSSLDEDHLDDETREAVNEFGAAATRASDLSADLAKQLHDLDEKASRATPHAVRRGTPPTGGVKAGTPASGVTAPAPAPAPVPVDDDAALDRAFSDPEENESEPELETVVMKVDAKILAKAAARDDHDEPAVIVDGPGKAAIDEPVPVDKPKPVDQPKAVDKPKPDDADQPKAVAKSPKQPVARASKVPFLLTCLLIAMAGAFGVAILRGWI